MKTVEIAPGIEIVDLALWLPRQKVLVVSDFHIGYEEALNMRGILLPRHQFKDTKERLQKIFASLGTKPKKIIITGDLKYEFGTVNREERFGISELLSFLSKNCRQLIILKGNHDKILNFTKSKILLKVKIGDVLFHHGDTIVNDIKVKTIVVGHAHPAIKLSDGLVAEKVKCFVRGKWKGKTLIVLPSFNLVTEGTDVLSEKVLSPYLNSAKNAEVWAVPEFGEVLYFGKLKHLN
jgi:putative SbcD/Mre11-related phosphoesterase